MASPVRIACSFLSEADRYEAIDLLTEAFCLNDPIEIALRITPDEFRKMIEPELDAVLHNNLSLVAREVGSGRMVGVLLAADALSESVDSCSAASRKFDPISEIARNLSNFYLNNRDVLPGACLYLFVVGVHPEATGNGFGKMLIGRVLQNARQRGFQSAYALATNLGSMCILERHGFHGIKEVDYQTYRYQGRAVFASITEHPGIVLMENDNLADFCAGQPA